MTSLLGNISDFVSPQAIARLRAANEKTMESESGTSINSEIVEKIRENF